MQVCKHNLSRYKIKLSSVKTMAYTLRQLTYAVAVADSGSITEASARLGISQPAISAALKELEAEFGISIFLRQPAHRIALSPAGQRFINRARRLLDESHEFENDALGLSREVQGPLDVGCFLPTAPFILPLIIEYMAEHHPGMDIRIHEGDLDEINQWLTTGEIEAALTYDMRPHPGVQFESLIEAPVHAVLPDDDPLAKRQSISLYDLVNRDMVAFDLPITPQFFRGLFLSLGIEPRIAYYVKSFEMVRSLVGGGLGFSLLVMRPHSETSYSGGKLTYVPLSDDLPHPHYGMAFMAVAKPRRLFQVFADGCRHVLKEEGRAESYFVRDPSSKRRNVAKLEDTH